MYLSIGKDIKSTTVKNAFTSYTSTNTNHSIRELALTPTTLQVAINRFSSTTHNDIMIIAVGLTQI